MPCWQPDLAYSNIKQFLQNDIGNMADAKSIPCVYLISKLSHFIYCYIKRLHLSYYQFMNINCYFLRTHARDNVYGTVKDVMG